MIDVKFARRTALAAFMLMAAATAVSGAVVVGIADICATNSLSQAGTEYANAVYAAGAVPYLLPATTNAEAVAALVDRVDMLLLAGGEDVDPSRYRETDRGKLGEVNVRRDVWEFALLDAAVRRRIPVLGICRGCQLLNVRFGGTLWQDVPSEVAGARQHRISGEHAISVVGGSYLSKLTGASESSVNSRHHQAVKEVADGFKVTATSPDGIVEAIEGVAYPAVGVQFHPERLFDESGRREFLPLFRGDFASLKPKARAEADSRSVGVFDSGIGELTAPVMIVGVEVKVFSQGCPGLADAIELGTADAKEIAHDNLVALVGQYRLSGTKAPLRAVILGCTHYPFLMPTLERTRLELGMDFIFVDPAVDTAEECYRALKAADMLAEKAPWEQKVEAYVSIPSKTLPDGCVSADGTLANSYKYGREPGCDEVTTKFVPLKSGNVSRASLGRLVELLPRTRAELTRNGDL